jgi:hypothetical protein
MILLDVFYTAVATIVVIALLQLITFAVVRIMYPPEPKVIYRDVPVHAPPTAPPSAPQMAPINLPLSVPVTPPVSVPLSASLPPVLTQQTQEVQLPEYEPRSTPSSTSLRLDSGFPDGLQETRPPGV